jgi:GDP/UDP-N,N'-diacetylbacillosamine 2-epimerase (hydrolysing)
MSREASTVRRICFVSGTRAELGLMGTTLRAIQARADLHLDLVVTGMHLDPRHGGGPDAIAAEGWKVSAVAPWPADSGRSPTTNAVNTGNAIAHLAGIFQKLRSDIVLVTGDRPEAFAAATAAHIAHRIVAHVHGGDRAIGQIDDSLRHAITKLAHLHFPATPGSARRIARLGEDKWRIHAVGAPGIDGIRQAAWPVEKWPAQCHNLLPGRYALVVLHPVVDEAAVEYRRARMVLKATLAAGVPRVAIVCPNNDPGCDGILRAWEGAGRRRDCVVWRNLPRGQFLGMLSQAAMLVGNSSAGIIEAASFGTPVIDVGPRQMGRECAKNVCHVSYEGPEILKAVARVWHGGHPRRWRGENVYGADGAGRRIAAVLGRVSLDRLRTPKLITF